MRKEGESKWQERVRARVCVCGRRREAERQRQKGTEGERVGGERAVRSAVVAVAGVAPRRTPAAICAPPSA